MGDQFRNGEHAILVVGVEEIALSRGEEKEYVQCLNALNMRSSSQRPANEKCKTSGL